MIMRMIIMIIGGGASPPGRGVRAAGGPAGLAAGLRGAAYIV